MPPTPASSAIPRNSRSRRLRREKRMTGRSASTCESILKTSATRRAQTRRDHLHALRRRHGAQKSYAGERLGPERYVSQGRGVQFLPRRSRNGEQRGSDQARQPDVPRMPRPEIAERPARASIEPTRTIAPAARGTIASPVTCPKSSRPCPRISSAPIPSVSSRPRKRNSTRSRIRAHPAIPTKLRPGQNKI